MIFSSFSATLWG